MDIIIKFKNFNYPILVQLALLKLFWVFVFVTKWGSQGAANGQFEIPWGIAIDSSGNVFVADTANHRIQKFTNSGTFVTKWGSEVELMASSMVTAMLQLIHQVMSL